AYLGFDLLSRFASFFGAVNHTHRIAFVTFLLQRFLHLFGYVRGFAAQTADIALIELIVWSLGCEWLAQNTSPKLCHTVLAAGVVERYQKVCQWAITFRMQCGFGHDTFNREVFIEQVNAFNLVSLGRFNGNRHLGYGAPLHQMLFYSLAVNHFAIPLIFAGTLDLH